MRVQLLVHFIGGFEVPVLGPGEVNDPYARRLSSLTDVL